MRKPVRVCEAFTKRLHDLVEEYNMEIPEGFVLFGTRTNRGRCHPNGTITVPTWTERRGLGKTLQYLAHELAHGWVHNAGGCIRYHNKSFMEYMMILCPEEHWHYELDYKPRAAAGAGINK